MQKHVPSSIAIQRQQRRKEIMSTILSGIGLRFAIIIAEIAGYFYLQSSALLLDGLSSLLDVGASLLLMLCVYLADKPPDRHHPLGHGRFEPIAGFQLGIFLVILGGYLGIKQCIAAVGEVSLHVINPYTWVIPTVAVILLEIGYQRLKRIAKKQNSPALLADAIHYRIDGVSSLVAVLALALGAVFPHYSLTLDHIGAFFIAVFMVIIGVKAAIENIHPLLDRAPEKIYFEKVEKAALQVFGVLGTEKIRIQSYGPDAFVSIDIEVEEAHLITQKVRLEIQSSWPAVRDVIVHVEPHRK
jgi:cation diffusion facilitator family transporter